MKLKMKFIHFYMNLIFKFSQHYFIFVQINLNNLDLKLIEGFVIKMLSFTLYFTPQFLNRVPCNLRVPLKYFNEVDNLKFTKFILSAFYEEKT